MKKNVMKNILAVSVVAAMAMSVAACGNTTETSAETEETVVETSEETVAETEETVAETEETVAETEETVAETEESAAIELDGEIDEDLIGSWTMEEDGAVVTYTFNDDNTGAVEMSFEDESAEFEIVYSADGENITVVMVDYPDDTDEATYTIDGDTLSLVTENETMELTREA
jgi:uncharacterized protein YjgD (DUF1641 family)